MTKVIRLNCDKIHKIKLLQNSNSNRDKTQIVTKLKNSNCDKTQKLKLWQNLKTQIVTKLTNSNCDQTQKLKLIQTSKTQIMTKLKNSNCDKTEKFKLWRNLTPRQPMRCSLCSFSQFLQCFLHDCLLVVTNYTRLLGLEKNA